MAKLTREQYNKWNSQAKNGFQLDLQYFLTWNEKTLGIYQKVQGRTPGHRDGRNQADGNGQSHLSKLRKIWRRVPRHYRKGMDWMRI